MDSMKGKCASSCVDLGNQFPIYLKYLLELILK